MSKNNGLFGLVSAVISGASAFSGLRAVKETGDKLALANAIGSLIVSVTAGALAVRSFRENAK